MHQELGDFDKFYPWWELAFEMSEHRPQVLYASNGVCVLVIEEPLYTYLCISSTCWNKLILTCSSIPSLPHKRVHHAQGWPKLFLVFPLLHSWFVEQFRGGFWFLTSKNALTLSFHLLHEKLNSIFQEVIGESSIFHTSSVLHWCCDNLLWTAVPPGSQSYL